MKKHRTFRRIVLCLLLASFLYIPVGAAGTVQGSALLPIPDESGSQTTEKDEKKEPVCMDISRGSITIGKEYQGVNEEGQLVRGVHAPGNLYVITGSYSSDETGDAGGEEHTVSVQGDSAETEFFIQLRQMELHAETAAPFAAEGKGTLHLILEGKNRISAAGDYCSAVQVNDMKLSVETIIDAKEEGELYVSSDGRGAGIGSANRRDCDITVKSGVLNAEGGQGGAGIGSGYGGVALVCVQGGRITASGGSQAAGIGSGMGGKADVRIEGGTVVSIGGIDGAGIGSGLSGDAEITVQNGELDCTGGIRGAGIGSGTGGDAKISVHGGKITAVGGYLDSPANGGCGIGSGGYDSNSNGGLSKVRIDGGTVNAKAGKMAAGIGCGPRGSAEIEVTGGRIQTEGNSFSTGIGGGNGSNATIVISGGEVESKGGTEAAGIGTSGGAAKICIEGGTVSADGALHSSGIGCGYKGSAEITVSGGSVRAGGGASAAGLGGGFGSGVEVNVSGGEIVAEGGSRGAGIGSGYRGSSSIRFSGGSVVSIGGKDSAGIGSGYEGRKAELVIRGGSVCTVSGEGGVLTGNGTESVTVTNGSDVVKYHIVQLSEEGKQQLQSLDGYSEYGLKDAFTTLEGYAYLWLPDDRLPGWIRAGQRVYKRSPGKSGEVGYYVFDEEATEKYSDKNADKPEDSTDNEEPEPEDSSSRQEVIHEENRADSNDEAIIKTETNAAAETSGNTGKQNHTVSVKGSVQSAFAAVSAAGGNTLPVSSIKTSESLSLPAMQSAEPSEENIPYSVREADSPTGETVLNTAEPPTVQPDRQPGQKTRSLIIPELLLGVLIIGITAGITVFLVRRKRYV